MDFKGICVVEVSGDSCANCISLMPILNKIINNRNDCNLYHIEIDENNMDIVNKYEIDRVPTILVLKDNKEIARARGFYPEEILTIWLDDKINQAKRS